MNFRVRAPRGFIFPFAENNIKDQSFDTIFQIRSFSFLALSTYVYNTMRSSFLRVDNIFIFAKYRSVKKLASVKISYVEIFSECFPEGKKT